MFRFLSGMSDAELLRQLVGPGNLDARELKDHFRCQRTDGARERIGSLVTADVKAVEALADGTLVHLPGVRRDVL